MNCFIYVISIAICKPNLYVFIDSEVNFACSFYNKYKFSVAQKVFCTPWSRNSLTPSRLLCFDRKRPRWQFFSRYVNSIHGVPVKCLGNWNFDVFRYKNPLTFICHQHQDLTIAKDNNFEIKQ
jgi:hypothetical protein